MRTVVVSDLHLGSRYFRIECFRRFLRTLPPDVRLVLNGDTLDAPRTPLPDDHQALLDELVDFARQREVVWVRGNHDDGFVPPEHITAVESLTIERRLAVLHGDRFDNVMPRYRWFLKLFQWLHAMRMKLGARPVHVARAAKRLKPLYAFLCRNVRLNALEYADEHEFEAIACGHVHNLEDKRIGRKRYLNTGSWTDEETGIILIDDLKIELIHLDTWLESVAPSAPLDAVVE